MLTKGLRGPVEAHSHEGHATRARIGLAVARIAQAGDAVHPQHLDSRRRRRPVVVVQDLDIGRVVGAVQDTAAAVVGKLARPVVGIARTRLVVIGRHDDAGRAGVHAEAPRLRAFQLQAYLGHVLQADRAVGEGNLDRAEAAVLP